MRYLTSRKRIHLLAQTLHICFTPQGEAPIEAPIPRASAPASTGCVLQGDSLRAYHSQMLSRQSSGASRSLRSGRPQAGCSLMTAPQPVRDASIASVTRRQELPTPGLEPKTKGFLHMSKARRHRHVTLIMRSGFSPRGEPLGFEPPL